MSKTGKIIDRFNQAIEPLSYKRQSASSCRYKAVMFDLDGTLLDTVPHICASYEHTFRHFGLEPISDEECMSGIGYPLRAFVQNYVVPELLDDFVREYRAFNEQNMIEKCMIFWPAMQLLEDLQRLNVPMGVVTAKGPSAVNQNLSDFDLHRFFLSVIDNTHTTKHKPDPAPLRLCMENMSRAIAYELQPEDVLYVGDSSYDVAAAANLACDAALVQWTRMPLEPIRQAGSFFVLYDSKDCEDCE